MQPILEQRTLNAPIQRVWDVVTDLEDAAAKRSTVTDVERLTEGEFGVGTRWRETRQGPMDITIEPEVTNCQPPETFSVRFDSAAGMLNLTYRLEPRGERSTHVTMSMDSGESSGVVDSVRRAASVVGTPAVAKLMRQDLEDLAAIVEPPLNPDAPDDVP